MRRLLAFITLACCLMFGEVAHRAGCQTTQSTPSGTKPVSLAHLYWHFLAYQHYLDETATAREKQGKDGQWVRSYLQQRLGFTDAEFAPIRESADRLTAKVKALDDQAVTIATAYRDAKKKGLIPPGSPPPDYDKLKALTAEREADINAEIKSLDDSLAPQQKTALDKFLKERFVTNISNFRPATAVDQGSPVPPPASVRSPQP